jgi:hypothetical protein
MVELSITNAFIFLLVLAALVGIGFGIYKAIEQTNIQDATSDPKLETNYKNQVKLLSDTINPVSIPDTFAIQINEQTISENYNINSGYNGVSAGPITIANGITVTIASGSSWSIV